ncbi:hypothetical protein J6590_044714 [Homalodisca vitripennis]|nr:hypothetical protein J6590_044714 [Homalodisca vitripennis]
MFRPSIRVQRAVPESNTSTAGSAVNAMVCQEFHRTRHYSLSAELRFSPSARREVFGLLQNLQSPLPHLAIPTSHTYHSLLRQGWGGEDAAVSPSNPNILPYRLIPRELLVRGQVFSQYSRKRGVCLGFYLVTSYVFAAWGTNTRIKSVCLTTQARALSVPSSIATKLLDRAGCRSGKKTAKYP